MGNLRRYYYNNKTKIWKAILIIASVLLLIKFANYLVKINNTKKVNNNISENKIVDNSSLSTSNSTVTGNSINETKLKNEVTIIEQFLNFCNNKNFEKAYEMLSDECKENLFSTYDKFKSSYGDVIFTSKKTYSMENWSKSTYKVRIAEDILTTGKTTNNGIAIQEYITIIRNNEEYKLNINNYIGRTEINSSSTQKDITIKVLSKETFMDYEIYKIEVTNNTKNTIYLDNGEDTSTVYVQDSKGVKYEAASNELIYDSLKILPGQKIKYSIKYTNTYITNRTIKYLAFDKIIMNYDEYIKNTDNYDNTLSFKTAL